MLNGVGGRTIAEAKQHLSYPETLLWYAYYQKYGSLNTNRRLQQELAELKLMLAAKLGATDTDLYDYMPNEDAPDITFDEMRKQYENS